MLNIGVIGAGRIGAIHAANVAASPKARLTWVCDPVPGAAARLAEFGARASLDPAEVIAADDVDAIVVCSPTPTHVGLILAGVEIGKAVLCEKPVDLDSDRARECQQAVEAAAGKVMIGFNRRFDPTFAQVHARLRDGEIGKIEQLTIVSRDPSAPPVSYIAQSGGIFRDMTIHDFDMANFFLGPIETVLALGQNVVDPQIAEAGDSDAAVVLLKAASGAVGTIINSRRCAYGYDQRLEAFGSLGMLEGRNQHATSVALSTSTFSQAANRVQDFFLQRYAEAYRLELDAFIEAVAGNGEFSPSLADGVAALALADAALESSKTGLAVAPVGGIAEATG
ncbi:MAG: inositol 2-dehydrogenase [Propionibacteriaceae bacterium]|jgi:myo-inositol 2-dehydrogenase/D-chiro-inositol 1-dehydrogenase|nr:inositol 2-dehydrogenase [Propionibacteriaceae bacterium]